jgi:putative DNA primase/helicase
MNAPTPQQAFGTAAPPVPPGAVLPLPPVPPARAVPLPPPEVRPEAMRDARRWMLWRSIPHTDPAKKPRKVPYYADGKPRTGTLDTPEDQARLAPFDEALRVLQGGGFTGLGFALGPDGTGGYWQGIDLDGLPDRPALQEVQYELPGYTETSPSGTGRHAIGYGRHFDSMGSNTSGIEAYAAGRYFTVTGADAAGTPECLADFVESRLAPMHGTAPRPPVKDAGTIAGVPLAVTVPPETLDDLRSALLSLPADDRGLWVSTGLALKSLGDDGRELWLAWSSTCEEKYDPIDAMATWNSFRPERTGYRAVFAEAQRNGWVNPRTGGALPSPGQAFAPLAPGVSDALPPPALTGTEEALITEYLLAADEDRNALAFTLAYRDKLRYAHDTGTWHVYRGGRWEPDLTGGVRHSVRNLCRSIPSNKSKASKHHASVEGMCKNDPAHAVRASEVFDQNNYHLNTPAGVVDLIRGGSILAHHPDLMVTKSTAVSPSVEGGDRFLRFLEEITNNDAELIEFLQVSLGACLSGALESHWLMFWIGTGRNGKNTLGDLVMHIMGDYAKKIPATTLMAKDHEAHPTELASLLGCRLAVSSEVEQGAFWHETRINELTGDSTISARFMRQDYFEFRRTHKHLIFGNHRPRVRAISEALKSRIKIVPFNASFIGREDPELPGKLLEEAGFVLSWLVHGHTKWLAAGRKLPKCAAVDCESGTYFASQSVVEMWIEENLNVVDDDGRGGSGWPKASTLYDDYARWKRNRGESPVSMTIWGETMGRRFEKVKSDGVRYKGCDLPIVAPFSSTAPRPL